MEKCNVCGKQSGISRCGNCKSVWYCCKLHQQQDWPDHKTACRVFSNLQKQHLTTEESCPADQYAGTFRWTSYTKFRTLPPLADDGLDLESSILQYLAVRLSNGAEDSEERITVDVPDADALSFPVSFLYGMRQILFANEDLRRSFRTCETLTVLALGCSARAEELILQRSSYWTEIGLVLRRQQVRLFLVGPEMSPEGHGTTRALASPGMCATCFRGTTGAFLEKHRDELRFDARHQTYVIAYNTGMATGDANLRRSWAADVRALLTWQLPTIFTCANDHSDLQGERQLMEKELGAQYVLYPRRNPMAAVTVMHPPGGRETQWYAANAFLYAVRGFREPNVGICEADAAAAPAAAGNGRKLSVLADSDWAPAAPASLVVASASTAAADVARGGGCCSSAGLTTTASERGEGEIADQRADSSGKEEPVGGAGGGRETRTRTQSVEERGVGHSCCGNEGLSVSDLLYELD